MNRGITHLDRRTLLIGGGAGVGLVIAFALLPRHGHSALIERPGEQAFGNYLKIGRDGRVTVAVAQAETGQGIWTALPQLVADELGAAWEDVAVEPAPLAPVYANSLASGEGWFEGLGVLKAHRISANGHARITAGSTSIRAFEQPMREAGAIARAMLIAAAADLWNVPENECDTADGFVVHGRQRLTFAELAEAASDRAPPGSPKLRSAKTSRLAGQPLQRLDVAAKSDGSFRFAADVRLPRMLFAAARIAPPHGRLTGFANQTADRLPGLCAVVSGKHWIAVAADGWWAAERALHAADPHFSAPATSGNVRALFEQELNADDLKTHFSAPATSGNVRALFEQELNADDLKTHFERGDYASTVAGSRPLAATYWIAPAQHLCLEPLTATARFSDDRLEVWAAAQAPEFARSVAAESAGIQPTDVTFYPMPVGEPGGRAIEADAIPIAVELARKLRRPVQVSLSQSASQNHDRAAPGALARMMALPGAGGITSAWEMRIATANGLTAALARLAGADEPKTLGSAAMDGAVPPYDIPNVRIAGAPVPAPFTPGYMRGSPEREMVFSIESFVDELARASGQEPLAFRMAMLGSNPRLARCLQMAASAAGWDGGGQGSIMGIAGASVFGSHIGLIAEATLGADRRVKVHRLVAAVDCGRVVNPGIALQQIEGGLLWGLGLATTSEPEWVVGVPRARPLGSVGLPHIGDNPQFMVQLIPSVEAPGGISGLGPAVVAPAVANAIHAGTGRRLRELPFNPVTAA